MTKQNQQNPFAELRSAFSTFMTGVTIVTSVDDQQQPIGFTANSFTSVSLTPPLILYCVDKSSMHLKHYTEGKRFAINILSEQQQDLAITFSRSVEARFANVAWSLSDLGSPIIEGNSAFFDCEISQVIEAGDHYIVIGKVVNFAYNALQGLGFARGKFFTLGMSEAAVSALTSGIKIKITALIESHGKLLMQKNQSSDQPPYYDLPSFDTLDGKRAMELLKQLLADVSENAEIGFIYSVYHNHAERCQEIFYRCAALSTQSQWGEYIALDALPINQVPDKAIQSILKRYQDEHKLQNYGVYFGDESKGEVHYNR